MGKFKLSLALFRLKIFYYSLREKLARSEIEKIKWIYKKRDLAILKIGEALAYTTVALGITLILTAAATAHEDEKSRKFIDRLLKLIENKSARNETRVTA